MKNFLLAPIGILFCIALNAQKGNFPILYDEVMYTDIRGVIATSDGQFALTGLKKTTDYPMGNMYLKKIDVTGALVWEKDFGVPYEDGGNFLMNTADGGILISGHVEYSNELCDGYVVKTDVDGQIEWKMMIGDWGLDEVCNGGTQMPNGDIYLTGRVGSLAADIYDVFLCRISKDGTLIFSKKIPFYGSEYGKYICPTQDGNLLITGYSFNLDDRQEKMMVMKVDPDGNYIWKKDFGFGVHTRARGVCETADHNYAVVGGSAKGVYRKDYQQMKILVLDEYGQLVKEVTPLKDAGNGFLFDIIMQEDGSFMACGAFQKEGEEQGHPCLLFLDKNFNLISYSLGTINKDSWGYCLVPMGGHDFLVAGMSDEGDEMMSGLVDRFSFQTLGTSTPQLLDNVLVTPNPFRETTYIRLDAASYDNTLYIYNSSGQLVRSIHFYDKVLKLDRSTLAEGIYSFEIIDNKKAQLISVGRLVAE